MQRYRVRHETRYHYQGEASRCLNKVHLQPRETDRQHCKRFDLTVNPEAESITSHLDYFGNHQHQINCAEPHAHFQLIAESELEIQPTKQASAEVQSLTCADVLRLLNEPETPEARMAGEFVLPSPFVPFLAGLGDFSQACFEPGRSFMEAVNELNGLIFEKFEYDPHATDLATPVAKAFEDRKGVCQDFAHIAICALRTLGFAARYVSGYLETLPPPGQEKLVGSDASHAWFSVFVPGYGWWDFDPTNNQQPNEQYITLAWGRDYSDVSPVSGIVFGGGEQSLEVLVDVTQLS